jgi:type III protein arginine methyltransferase
MSDRCYPELPSINYGDCVTATPSADDINREFQKAIEHYQGNRFAEASALLDRLAPHCGGRAEYFRLRGHIAMRNRDAATAFTNLQRAAELAPRTALHQFELGEHYRMSGKPAEAIRLYRQALALEPGAAIVRITMAGVLAMTGNVRAAIGEVDQAVASAGDNLQAYLAAALAYRDLKQVDAAIRSLRRAQGLRPGDLKIQAFLRELYTSQVRPWHFRMMNDTARNRAYDAAIRRAVGPETHVLEIGTGSGLLAMMAARAGARLVSTCEQVESIAETAAEIVKRNGFGERVKVIPKRSTQLAVGVDLPERADVLISEILSDKLLEEGVLSSTAHARHQLLKPNGIMIPRAIAAVVRLAGGDFLREAAMVDRIEGFDLTPFNRFCPNSVSINMEAGQIESYSDDIEVFRFELLAEGHRPEERELRLTARRTGTAIGLLQWLRLQLDDTETFENRPPDTVTPSAWRQVFYPFNRPLEVREGETVALWAAHDVVSMAFAPLPKV